MGILTIDIIVQLYYNISQIGGINHVHAVIYYLAAHSGADRVTEADKIGEAMSLNHKELIDGCLANGLREALESCLNEDFRRINDDGYEAALLEEFKDRIRSVLWRNLPRAVHSAVKDHREWNKFAEQFLGKVVKQNGKHHSP